MIIFVLLWVLLSFLSEQPECDCDNSEGTLCVDGHVITLLEKNDSSLIYSICTYPMDDPTCPRTEELTSFDWTVLADNECGADPTEITGTVCTESFVAAGSTPPLWSDCVNTSSCQYLQAGDPLCSDSNFGPVLHCDEGVMENTCKLLRIDYPPSLELGSTSFIGVDGCNKGCILGPSCASCQTNITLECDEHVEITVERPSTLEIVGCGDNVLDIVETGDPGQANFSITIINGGRACTKEFETCGKFWYGCSGGLGFPLEGIEFQQGTLGSLMSISVSCLCDHLIATSYTPILPLDPKVFAIDF